MIEKSTGMEIENTDNSSTRKAGQVQCRTDPTMQHNKCVDMLLCGIRKQNGMIKRYDQYLDMFMVQAGETRQTYKNT